MTQEIDRILTDDPAPPPSPYFAAHVMRAVRAAAEPPPRLGVRDYLMAPAMAGGVALVGLALAVYVNSSLVYPGAAVLIALAVWRSRVAAAEFEY